VENFDWLTGFVFPYLNFFLFLFLAYRFFKKPTTTMLRNKKMEFERLVKEAQAARHAAEEKNDALSQRLKNLDKEIAEIRSVQITHAEKRADEIRKQAQALTSHIESEAKRMAEAEVSKAKLALQEEILESLKRLVSEKVSRETKAETQTEIMKSRLSSLAGINMEN
jgi:F0F1-type ATP synthase membrane subunit b/b'